MLSREPTTVPFTTEAMRANLLRLENEWETVQASRYRNAIYQYLTAVFGLVRCGRRKVRQSTVPVGPCTCEGTTGKRAGTVCRSDPLHGRSWQGR